MIEVTFQSLGRTGRTWTATFDLGDENGAEACRVAFSHNARIIKSGAVNQVTVVETEDPWNEDRWGGGLNMDVEAPHCRECDDYHWGECPSSRDNGS